MPSFIPATGITLHLAGVCVNRIGVFLSSRPRALALLSSPVPRTVASGVRRRPHRLCRRACWAERSIRLRRISRTALENALDRLCQTPFCRPLGDPRLSRPLSSVAVAFGRGVCEGQPSPQETAQCPSPSPSSVRTASASIARPSRLTTRSSPYRTTTAMTFSPPSGSTNPAPLHLGRSRAFARSCPCEFDLERCLTFDPIDNRRFNFWTRVRDQ